MIDVQTKSRQIIALSQPIHSCTALVLAGCIIGYGRGYAADAVPQLPEHWCSFCQPQKDNRLSQPHLVLIHGPTGLKLRTRASQVIHPNRKAHTRLHPTNILEKASIFSSNIQSNSKSLVERENWWNKTNHFRSPTQFSVEKKKIKSLIKNINK